METPIQVAAQNSVRIKLAATVTGLTEKAIRRKIEKGEWVEGKQYTHAPDGTIWINLEGVRKWVEKRVE